MVFLWMLASTILISDLLKNWNHYQNVTSKTLLYNLKIFYCNDNDNNNSTVYVMYLFFTEFFFLHFRKRHILLINEIC